MKYTGFCLLLIAVVACAAPQSEDELHIPEENDNQFPPDNILDLDKNILEGSGAGAIEDPTDVVVTGESTIAPPLEDVQGLNFENIEPIVSNKLEDTSCPKLCVCHIEGDSNVVDCSRSGLTEFPAPINAQTTTLNIHNNNITEIPKDISLLKNLKVLNAENNLIQDLTAGSISELSELTVLKLGNNRLIEYPRDLKNSFGLTKLEELDLEGNDIRTPFSPDTFSQFTALKKLTIPTGSKELAEDLCVSLQKSLETVCVESCSRNTIDCPEAPSNFEEDLLSISLPGTISLNSALEDNVGPIIGENTKIESDQVDATEATETKSQAEINETPAPPEAEDFQQEIRSAVNKVPEIISPLSTMVETPKDVSSDDKTVDVAVGATTSGTKTGGVDKSVIGMIVAGMVLVVAGITIKKNWSSIRNKFSSTPRAANEHPGANGNGIAPEEVPLQEKSPV